VASIKDNNNSSAPGGGFLASEEMFCLTNIKEVQVLLHVQELVDAFVISKDYTLAAKRIVACIEETKDKTTGMVGSLMPLSLHWPLIVIAKEILREEECQESDNLIEPVSAFDQNGLEEVTLSLHPHPKWIL
jgi:hypothetical protein